MFLSTCSEVHVLRYTFLSTVLLGTALLNTKFKHKKKPPYGGPGGARQLTRCVAIKLSDVAKKGEVIYLADYSIHLLLA